MFAYIHMLKAQQGISADRFSQLRMWPLKLPLSQSVIPVHT